MTTPDPDGSRLLATDEVAEVLAAAVRHAGGTLVDWRMDHIDANPERSTTATYHATVDWPHGRQQELLGVSARAGGPASTDRRAEIFEDGERRIAVWLYPDDPDLPGLRRAAYPATMAEVLTGVGLGPVVAEQLELEMVTYRPRRRAVLRVASAGPGGRSRTCWVKVLRQGAVEDVEQRHRLLTAAGVPAPTVLGRTPDALLLLAQLTGRPLARAIFDERPPVAAERIVEVLDALPAAVAQLPRRAPWTDAVEHYAQMIARALPAEERRLQWMVGHVVAGTRGLPPGMEPTHGDFHEGQVHVSGAQDGPARVVGLLDVDTIGPGHRVDDLACLVAHLSTVQRMNAVQAARVQGLLATWVPVFDRRVDPVQLRLRAAAVVISLATGPHRGQEPHWERETGFILDAAEALIRQVR